MGIYGGLPDAPNSLCFEHEDFLKEDFSINHFISKHSQHATLEVLKNDLMVYSKTLHSSILSVIDEDYISFVKLSNNLVGISRIIDQVFNDFLAAHQEISNVTEMIDTNKSQMMEKLDKYASVRRNEMVLVALQETIKTNKTLTALIKECHDGTMNIVSGLVPGALIGRMAWLLACTQHKLYKLKCDPFLQQQWEAMIPKIKDTKGCILKILENQFFLALSQEKIDMLKVCMQAYRLLEMEDELKKAFRQHFVLPFLSKMMQNSVMPWDVQALQWLYEEVLGFVSVHYQCLKQAVNTMDRFCEIAGMLETSLMENPEFEVECKEMFCLTATHVLWKCLHLCWDPASFLMSLAAKFLQLSLQLVSRYNYWIQQMVLVNMHQDVHSLQKQFPDFVKKNIAPHFEKLEDATHLFSGKSEHVQCSQLVAECTACVEKSWIQLLSSLDNVVVIAISQSCNSHLQAVTDIPRLYHRTNRTSPVLPSPYVDQLLLSIGQFLNFQNCPAEKTVLKTWMTTVFQDIAHKYASVTMDVLHSVQKMEESLKRLKKAHTRVSSAATKNQLLSDETKIRQQLCLDIEHFLKQAVPILSSVGLEEHLLAELSSMLDEISKSIP